MTKKELEKLSKLKAQQTIDFIECLKHTKDPFHGVNFELLDWQKRIIKDVYGTLKPDGTRQFKFVYLEVPKKQGKSEIGAAVGLKHLCADGEYAAEVYGCAADRAQASLVFDVAVDMVDQEPMLKKVIKPVLSKKRLIYLPTKSFYQVLSAEAYTKHGLNASAVIFDELHAQPNRKLWDVMTFGAGDARLQPIWWVITTSGNDPDRTSIGYEVHKKAEDILLGNKIDPVWYPVIFGYDPDEKRIWKGWDYEVDANTTWESPKVWTAVNPSVDKTVKFEKISEAYTSVKGNESDEQTFQQLRLNIWVKNKLARWMSHEKWDLCGFESINPLELMNRPCYGGLDLSSKLDITAFILLFPPTKEGEKFQILPYMWIPDENMKERVERDKVPYDKWSRQGLIRVTDGNCIDYAQIEQEIMQLKEQYRIEAIGFDSWNAYEMAQKLQNEGLEMIETRQGFKTMSPAMKDLESWIIGQKINHGNHPVLRWMAGNVEVKRDENDNIRPVKSKSTERIDGIVALLNAMHVYSRMADQVSVYENRGMRSLL